MLGVELLEWLRIDDPIGAVPVHGICGIWGTLSLGFFACGKYGATGPFAADNSAPLTGLFYGGGMTVLIAQAIGSAIVTVSTFGVALIVMYAVNAMGVLRVTNEGENHGLDLHEHGISAYPEYVISSTPSPAAMIPWGGRTPPPTTPPSQQTSGHPEKGPGTSKKQKKKKRDNKTKQEKREKGKRGGRAKRAPAPTGGEGVGGG